MKIKTVGRVVYIEVGGGCRQWFARAVDGHPQEPGDLAEANCFGGLGGRPHYPMAATQGWAVCKYLFCKYVLAVKNDIGGKCIYLHKLSNEVYF
jgi:hypothetical protein